MICSKALRLGALIVLALSLLSPSQLRAEDIKGMEQKSDYKRLVGKWLRPDGGYVLELKDVKSDGHLKALYFNPRPINVSKVEWRRMGERLQVFVELSDVNYPCCTYTLIYSPEQDSLGGYYYQAALGQTFDIVFVRMK